MAEAAASVWRMLVIGLFYGLLMPALTAALMPLNLFILSFTGLTRVSGQGSLGERFEDLVLSIPGGTYLSWMVNFSHGILAGLALAVLAVVVFRLAGPISNPQKAPLIYSASLLLSVVIVALVVAGPISLFEYLFSQYAA